MLSRLEDGRFEICVEKLFDCLNHIYLNISEYNEHIENPAIHEAIGDIKAKIENNKLMCTLTL